VGLVQEEDPGEEVPNAEHDAPEHLGGASAEEAGSTVPSAQNRTMPHWPIPKVDEGHGLGRVRVGSIQDADERTPV